MKDRTHFSERSGELPSSKREGTIWHPDQVELCLVHCYVRGSQPPRECLQEECENNCLPVRVLLDSTEMSAQGYTISVLGRGFSDVAFAFCSDRECILCLSMTLQMTQIKLYMSHCYPVAGVTLSSHALGLWRDCTWASYWVTCLMIIHPATPST